MKTQVRLFEPNQENLELASSYWKLQNAEKEGAISVEKALSLIGEKYYKALLAQGNIKVAGGMVSTLRKGGAK